MATGLEAGVGEDGQQRGVIDGALIIKLMVAGASSLSVGWDN